MCNNCKEIYDDNLKIYGISSFLFETDNFIVNVDSYLITKNHILIIPKHHFTSFANININETDELQSIIVKILRIFDAKNFIIFEYGKNIINEKNKICDNLLFHSHLNVIINIDINLNEILRNIQLNNNKSLDQYSFDNHYNKNFLNILKFNFNIENNYLLFVNTNTYYCIPECDIQGNEYHFFRKLIYFYCNKDIYNLKDQQDFKRNYEIDKSNFYNTINNFNNSKIKDVNYTDNFKLVRDNIIDIIVKEGRKVNYYIANNNSEYSYFLTNKLKEECNEFIESLSMNVNNIKEECADVLEVIENILILYDLKIEDIIEIKKQKNMKNGSFLKKQILLI